LGVVNCTFSTTNTGTTLAAYNTFISTLTGVDSNNCRAVYSSGGAAGGVVSEGMGYGILLTAITAAAVGPTNANFPTILNNGYQLFLAWQKMCRLSTSGTCQSPGYCGGASAYPCLPDWQWDNAITTPAGTGPAPDGDEDATTGMILIVSMINNHGLQNSYSWYNTMATWAYETCKQFYDMETQASANGAYQLVMLGSCWGGWSCSNPSYSAPAQYKLMRDYMNNFSSYLGFGTEGSTYVSKWNVLISTSYDLLIGNQCPSGIIPNWVVPNPTNPGLPGTTTCSGSGTPSAQYGSEAARTTWRVFLDYVLYPSDSVDAIQYLTPLANELSSIYSGGTFGNIADCSEVSSVFAQWTASSNSFIFAPTCTALVPPFSTITNQQTLVNTCGTMINGALSNTGYYALCWAVFGTAALNGDVFQLTQYVGATPKAASPVAPVAPVAPPTAPVAPPKAPVAPTAPVASTISPYTCGAGNTNTWFVEVVSNAPTTTPINVLCADGSTFAATYMSSLSKWQCSITGSPCLSPQIQIGSLWCTPPAGITSDSTASDANNSLGISGPALAGIIVATCLFVIVLIAAVVYWNKKQSVETV
jgi:hypothetical protein